MLAVFSRSVFSLVVLALVCVASGCVIAAVEEERPTVGRQLHELKLAHDAGAVSDAEYDDLRTAVLAEAEACCEGE